MPSWAQLSSVFCYEEDAQEEQEDEPAAIKPKKEAEEKYDPAVSEAIFGLPFDPRS